MDDCGQLLPKVLKPTVGVHNGSKTAIQPQHEPLSRSTSAPISVEDVPPRGFRERRPVELQLRHRADALRLDRCRFWRVAVRQRDRIDEGARPIGHLSLRY